MDKLAELVRDSEIRGAMAAFVDLGMVKVASQEEFDGLVEAVCQGIGDEEYDLQKVASVTESLLTAPETEGQEKTALLGTLAGAIRAGNLTDEERAALIEHYGLSSDASLGWRNAGRGFLGGNLGASLGLGLGALTKSPVLGGVGQFAGFAAGTKLMTDKYSKGNAKEIMKQRAKTAADTASATAPNTASDAADVARKAALGELLQMKVAGQIDEPSFIEAAFSLLENGTPENKPTLEKGAANNTPKQKVLDAEVTGGKKIPWKRVAKGGAAAAGIAGGAALAKSLYDKYSKRDKEEK